MAFCHFLCYLPAPLPQLPQLSPPFRPVSQPGQPGPWHLLSSLPLRFPLHLLSWQFIRHMICWAASGAAGLPRQLPTGQGSHTPMSFLIDSLVPAGVLGRALGMHWLAQRHALNTPCRPIAGPAQTSVFPSFYSATTHVHFLTMNLLCDAHFTNSSCFLQGSNHCKAKPAQPLCLILESLRLFSS